MEPDQTTCLDPYIASFEAGLSSKGYKPNTVANYRYLLRCFARLLEAEGIAPGALTPSVFRPRPEPLQLSAGNDAICEHCDFAERSHLRTVPGGFPARGSCGYQCTSEGLGAKAAGALLP